MRTNRRELVATIHELRIALTEATTVAAEWRRAYELADERGSRWQREAQALGHAMAKLAGGSIRKKTPPEAAGGLDAASDWGY